MYVTSCVLDDTRTRDVSEKAGKLWKFVRLRIPFVPTPFRWNSSARG